MKNQPNRIGCPSPTLNRAKGFTLVELLVVIAIIAVMAALIMAVTQKIRSKAYQANAMSSLRQVAAFSAAYSAENNGDINTMRYVGSAKEGVPNWIKNTFWGRLQPYLFPELTSSDAALKKEIKLRLDGLFKTDTDAGNNADPNGTPMTGTVVSGSRMYRDGTGLAIPFAFNVNLVPWSQFAKVSSFGDPSQVLYAVYGFGLFTEAHGDKYVQRPTNNTKPANNIYYLDDRKALAAFLDGHVESVTAPIPDRKFK